MNTFEDVLVVMKTLDVALGVVEGAMSPRESFACERGACHGCISKSPGTIYGLTADGNACAARKRSYRLTRFREHNRYLERSCERTARTNGGGRLLCPKVRARNR